MNKNLDKKIKEISTNIALGEYFTEYPDEKCWNNLSEEDIEKQLKTNEIIPWESFEFYDSSFFIKNIESLSKTIEDSIKYILKENEKQNDLKDIKAIGT